MEDCPACKGKKIATKKPLVDTTYAIQCKRCGEFELSYSLDSLFENKVFYHPLSSWIKEKNSYYGEVPLLTGQINDYFSIPDKTIKV